MTTENGVLRLPGLVIRAEDLTYAKLNESGNVIVKSTGCRAVVPAMDADQADQILSEVYSAMGGGPSGATSAKAPELPSLVPADMYQRIIDEALRYPARRYLYVTVMQLPKDVIRDFGSYASAAGVEYAIGRLASNALFARVGTASCTLRAISAFGPITGTRVDSIIFDGWPADGKPFESAWRREILRRLSPGGVVLDIP